MLDLQLAVVLSSAVNEKVECCVQLGSERPREGMVGSVIHAIEILRAVAEAGAPVGVNELARRIGLHKSSVSRIVNTLTSANLLRRDVSGGPLAIGTGLVALAAPLLAELSLTDVVRPTIEEIARISGETSSFNLWDNGFAVSIYQVAGSNSVQAFSAPGYKNPAHATAAGKILLAFQPEEIIHSIVKDKLQGYTQSTIVETELLLADLEQSRERGFSTNFGEYSADVGAVAAPVLDARGGALGCVAVAVPIYRLTAKRSIELGKLLVEQAHRIRSDLRLLNKTLHR
jgi:DNA-binding IclR family transcriptional regulator